MKVKKGFKLRVVCGEHIIVAEGDENIDFSNIISMNESSAYLWEKVQDLDDFTIEDLANLLCNQYDVNRDTALKDVTTLAAHWGEAEIIEGSDIPVNNENGVRIASDNTPNNEKLNQGPIANNQKINTNKMEEQPKKGFFRKLFS